MMQRIRRTAFLIAGLAVALGPAVLHAGEWSKPVAVLHEHLPCVTYRARLDGEFLVVQAKIEPGWHTFVMDNKQRSTEKLAGKQSLGVDGPTEIAVSDGLEVTGPWYQSAPKDFSKPDLRWYSWGYEGEAQFTAKVRRAGASSAEIGIRGQACTDAVCKNINVTIPLSIAKDADSTSTVDLKTLIQVRAVN